MTPTNLPSRHDARHAMAQIGEDCFATYKAADTTYARPDTYTWKKSMHDGALDLKARLRVLQPETHTNAVRRETILTFTTDVQGMVEANADSREQHWKNVAHRVNTSQRANENGLVKRLRDAANDTFKINQALLDHGFNQFARHSPDGFSGSAYRRRFRTVAKTALYAQIAAQDTIYGDKDDPRNTI